MSSPDKTPLTREAVDSWFTTRLQANRKRSSTKVTAADVEELLGGARGVKPVILRSLPVALGTGMLIAACVVALSVTSGARSFAQQEQSLVTRIHSAEGELAALKIDGPSPAGSFTEKLTAQLEAARKAGREIAKLQQEYATILFDNNAVSTAGGAVPEDAYRAAVAHQSTMVGYFTPESLGGDDGIDEGEMDPRFPWFVGYEADGMTVVDPSTSTWQLASVETTGSTGVFQAAWVNVDDEGDLHAWATASYDVDSERFGRFSVGKSTVANNAAQAGM